jgi:hypothetical protein
VARPAYRLAEGNKDNAETQSRTEIRREEGREEREEEGREKRRRGDREQQRMDLLGATAVAIAEVQNQSSPRFIWVTA